MLIAVAMSLNAGLARAADPNVGRAISTHVVQCIDVLGPGGRYQLTGDLDCLLVMITIQDGASLDLNGYKLSAPDGDTEINLIGTGTILKNGDVGPSAHYAIRVGGEGGHTVKDVVAPSGDGTVLVESNNNRLINNTISGVNSGALLIGGNNNELRGNTIVCGRLLFFDLACVNIVGTANIVIDNDISFSLGSPTCTLDLNAGLGIHGDANLVRRNLVTNSIVGIRIDTGSENVIARNTALHNCLDLVDATGDCTHNTWRNNTFETSSPACIK